MSDFNKVSEELLALLSGLDESLSFCSFGCAEPIYPGLEVKGLGVVALPVLPDQARALIEQARQAPFGRGEDTVVDTSVRRVWEIDAADVSFGNPRWDAYLTKICRQVLADFSIMEAVDAELYKLLIYEKDSFFLPHRDTEKQDGMFATLVITLPSVHSGGVLQVCHGDDVQTIDFSGSDALFQLQYAAFYSDCRHEVKPLEDGFRVSLVYNLSLADSKRKLHSPEHSREIEVVARLVAQIFCDSSRKKIAIPLEHGYSQAEFSAHALKGRDRSRLAVLREAGAKVGCVVHLALMSYFQTGAVDESDFYYNDEYDDEYEDEYDDDDVDETEEDLKFLEVFDERLTFEHWCDPDGKPLFFGEVPFDEDDILLDRDLKDFPFTQEYEGYTGNAGATLDRWYRGGMVVLWNGNGFFDSVDQTIALPELARRTQFIGEENRDVLTSISGQIMDQWVTSGFRRRTVSLPLKMLEQLDLIGELAPVKRFLSDILPRDFRGDEGPQLVILCHHFGWQELAPHLRSLFQTDAHEDGEYLGPLANIFGDLCSGASSKEQKALCAEFGDDLMQTLKTYDAQALTRTPIGRNRSWNGFLEPFLIGLHLLGANGLGGALAKYVASVSNPSILREVLLPSIETLGKKLAQARFPAFDMLLSDAMRQLQELTRVEPQPPADWRREATMACDCGDCKELRRFLEAGGQKVGYFKMAQARRSHLENIIRNCRADVDCHTHAQGSPHTLVCTKNQNSFKRVKTQYLEDLASLTKLERFARP